MSKYYAITDPHGCISLLKRALETIELASPDNKLFLLGDYIPHPFFDTDEHSYLTQCEASLSFIYDLSKRYPHQVTVLIGNHEYDLHERIIYEGLPFNATLTRWLATLPLYAETEHQIYVHSGIDESAENWKLETPDIMFLSKRHVDFGPFEKDIIAGHHVFDEPHFDGHNHYYIDLGTEKSHRLAVLEYDTASHTYSHTIVHDKGDDAMDTPQIDHKHLDEACYIEDPYALSPIDAKTIWSYIENLIENVATFSPVALESRAQVNEFDYARMKDPIKALFKVALTEMPSAREYIDENALAIIDATQPLPKPFILSDKPRGLSQCYNDMNIVI